MAGTSPPLPSGQSAIRHLLGEIRFAFDVRSVAGSADTAQTGEHEPASKVHSGRLRFVGEFRGQCRRLRTTAHTKFRKNIADMGLDRPFGHPK